jgi:xylan 1,4-beta-xylosidase
LETVSSVFFNAQHSPIGAFASFTLGSKGAKGGFGLELAKPSDQNVFIGLEEVSSPRIACLPFYESSGVDDSSFQVEGTHEIKAKLRLFHFADPQISRSFSPARDTWRAGDLTFTIHTPVMPAPEPGKAAARALMLAYVPALAVEITVDNRAHASARRLIFGFQGNGPHGTMRQLDDTARGRYVGIAFGGSQGIASDSPGVISAQGFTVEGILSESDPFNHAFGIGSVGLLIATAPPRRRTTFRFAACFHQSGAVTTGLPARYYYTRFFKDIEAVAGYALKNFPALKRRGEAFDRRFDRAKLNRARKFMLAHAIHSYYGSTELLETAGRPLWIVNEGEYRMINTLDLTVDQLFFEMKMNPWTVRNELDWFVRRYSYTDRVRLPGSAREYPGGLSFTHDMGVANHLSRPGHSVYERAGLKGCFSHMTQEELINWTVCALVYEQATRDRTWAARQRPVFRKVLDSLLNRDHPDPRQRDGIMSLDSSRCAGGAEITTYDSLDVSLGQARNNVYLGVKCWGTYVGLAAFFARHGDPKRAAICESQASLAARTLAGAADDDGLLPAILHENVASRIIPAIEGLIIPYALGLKSALSKKGPYGPLILTLKRHFLEVLKPGVCLFPNGAWKISSTSNNSWLSKIYLCQFIAEEILQCVSRPGMEKADKSHAAWLEDEANSYWAWSDQIVSGVAKGSKYYPRGVTAILWLDLTRRFREE